MRRSIIRISALRRSMGFFSRQIKYQHFGVPTVIERQRSDAPELQGVTSGQSFAIDAKCSTHYMHVQAAVGLDLERIALGAIEQAGVHARVLMDAHRAISAIG